MSGIDGDAGGGRHTRLVLGCKGDMKQQRVDTVETLASAVASFGDDFLFRGQIGHFGTNTVSGIRTSFDRQGCVPPLMIKWAHYAEFMLRQIADDPEALGRLEFVQAILQHYGFRSFFLDLSASAAVSAYFAGWRWTSRRTLDLVEDCFEDPVFTLRELATYEPAEGDTHLYVISKAALATAEIGVHNLSGLTVHVGGRPRYMAQQAWLAGPVHGHLPRECVVSRIVAPAEVFREFAAQAGLREVLDIFPDRRTDPVLHLLLSLPWVEIAGTRGEDEPDIEFFRRALDIPEYHEDELAKHQPPDVAFFCGAKLADYVDDPSLTLRTAPAHIIFGSYDGPSLFPRVSALVRRRKRVLFEVDELLWLPESLSGGTWGKGLWIEERPDGRIQLGDLYVEHPGRRMIGVGALAMWSYQVDSSGRWIRSPAEEDCDCGHRWRHEAHLSALGVLEHELGRRAQIFSEGSTSGSS